MNVSDCIEQAHSVIDSIEEDPEAAHYMLDSLMTSVLADVVGPGAFKEGRQDAIRSMVRIVLDLRKDYHDKLWYA